MPTATPMNTVPPHRPDRLAGGGLHPNKPQTAHPGAAGGARRAVTLVEVLTVLALVALVALPFTRMFTFGMQGSIESKEQVIAYNLAREKIEELKCLPFDDVAGDFAVFKPVYQRLKMFDMAEESTFNAKFNDIFTDERIKPIEGKELFSLFKEAYAKVYRREYLPYSDEYNVFRRVTKVEDAADKATPPRLKKVEVTVYDRNNHRIAFLVTMLGRHR